MRAKQFAYRKLLLAMIGITGLFSRLDVHLPTKWYSFIETLQVSTGVVHSRLCMVDEEVDREYREMEKDLERQLGLESFYSPEDIQEIKEEVEKEVKMNSEA
ncbi:MAG: hypothetical protein ACLFTA_01590 [Candidatus Nanohaloarchaea archaeon]